MLGGHFVQKVHYNAVFDVRKKIENLVFLCFGKFGETIGRVER
jgi:hypothetical protein